MLANPGGWVIQAPPATTPSYVSESFRPSSRVTVAFCLYAARNAATEVLRLGPTGIVLALRNRSLKLMSPGAHEPDDTRSLTVSARGTPVRVTADADGGSLTLSAGGRRLESWARRLGAFDAMQIGSIAPAHQSSITLTGVSVVASEVVVIFGSTTHDATAAITSVPWPGNPFSPTSFWNTPLPATPRWIPTRRPTSTSSCGKSTPTDLG